jgi:hypothetical protein
MSTKHSKDLSVSMIKASYLSILFAIPPAVVFFAAFVLLWGRAELHTAWQTIVRQWVFFTFIMLAAILMHELLHGITWMFFGKKRFSAIRFGFNMKALSPYAHCKEPMTAGAYRLGTLMPGLILGILPVFAALISGSGILMLFGLLFTVAAGGDMLVFWLLRKESSNVMVTDHPTNAGCILLEGETEKEIHSEERLTETRDQKAECRMQKDKIKDEG